MKRNVNELTVKVCLFEAFSTWLCLLVCLRYCYCFTWPYKNVLIFEKGNRQTFITGKK